jgi:hypothetical protein
MLTSKILNKTRQIDRLLKGSFIQGEGDQDKMLEISQFVGIREKGFDFYIGRFNISEQLTLLKKFEGEQLTDTITDSAVISRPNNSQDLICVGKLNQGNIDFYR